MCSAQLVRNANAPSSAGATILIIVRFDIDYRMNTFVWPCNEKRVTGPTHIDFDQAERWKAQESE